MGDRGLWVEAVRDVRPLRGERAVTPAVPPPVIAPTLTRAEQGSARPKQTPPLDRFAGIDHANAERLKRGRHRIEARLDLHGLTQSEAHRALSGFVAESRGVGRRCVLVITGRGRGQSGTGVLKNLVPRWLEEPALRPHVLAIAPAQPKHGGSGATYLLLRRR
ncbi:MAG: Smr/MutS family protein [Alphaproteobacteria bacterium]|nr:Smr/MutS family protein [Alphaproteobacteria bacterium]